MISSLDDEKLDRKDGLALQKMLESDQSIYKLRKYFAKQGYGISYPSLYKRVKRLLKKRLIEESIMGKTIENIHGAIYYRLTLAGILLFGKDETILSVLPAFKTDAIMRRKNAQTVSNTSRLNPASQRLNSTQTPSP